MPFQIIRNDITRVRADAIVNTANPEPCFAGGTDSAIYRAAGAKKLLAERKRIGTIAPGEAAVTAAFRLPAKYIIHTVGPAWIDGNHGEFEVLRSCYRKSLLLADQLGCESIAFPLIATGVYGFPKPQALEIALSVIREHLEYSDLDVTLVVFGRDSYQLASGMTERVEAYIDEKYVVARFGEEYGDEPASRRRDRWWQNRRERERYPSFAEMDTLSANIAAEAPAGMRDWEDEYDAIPMAEESLSFEFSGPLSSPKAREPKKATLEDAVNNLGESFQTRLLRMIDERGLSDPEVYKRANVDRKLFSKIRCSQNYIPKKKTIVAFAIALRLNLDDTRDLLASAGLTLTNNSKADVIVSFCLENEIYDIFEVNALLFKFDQPILG